MELHYCGHLETISVLYKEVLLSQGLINTNMVYLEPNTVSFISSVSLFQSAHIEGFYCIGVYQPLNKGHHFIQGTSYGVHNSRVPLYTIQ